MLESSVEHLSGTAEVNPWIWLSKHVINHFYQGKQLDPSVMAGGVGSALEGWIAGRKSRVPDETDQQKENIRQIIGEFSPSSFIFDYIRFLETISGNGIDRQLIENFFREKRNNWQTLEAGSDKPAVYAAQTFLSTFLRETIPPVTLAYYLSRPKAIDISDMQRTPLVQDDFSSGQEVIYDVPAKNFSLLEALYVAPDEVVTRLLNPSTRIGNNSRELLEGFFDLNTKAIEDRLGDAQTKFSDMGTLTQTIQRFVYALMTDTVLAKTEEEERNTNATLSSLVTQFTNKLEYEIGESDDLVGFAQACESTLFTSELSREAPSTSLRTYFNLLMLENLCKRRPVWAQQICLSVLYETVGLMIKPGFRWRQIRLKG